MKLILAGSFFLFCFLIIEKEVMIMSTAKSPSSSILLVIMRWEVLIIISGKAGTTHFRVAKTVSNEGAPNINPVLKLISPFFPFHTTATELVEPTIKRE